MVIQTQEDSHKQWEPFLYKELIVKQPNPLSSTIVAACFYFSPANVASYRADNVHPPLDEKAVFPRLSYATAMRAFNPDAYAC